MIRFPNTRRRLQRMGVTYQWTVSAVMGITNVEKEGTGFLCVDERINGGIEKIPIGSCHFIVDYGRSGGIGISYVVTAKHVVEDWIKANYKIYARFNLIEGGIVYDEVTEKWHTHSDEHVDLAMASITPSRGALTAFSRIRENAATEENYRRENRKWPLEEADPILYIAMLEQHHGYERNLPVVKSGNLALVTDELLQGHYGLSSYYLIDAQIYPGQSGAPVYKIEPDENNPNLKWMKTLGILVAGHESLQKVIERKVKKKKVQTKVYNLGIAFVVPVEKIIEMLDLPEVRVMREKAGSKPPKPTPVRATRPEQSSTDDDFTKKDFESALKKVSRRRKTKTSEPDEK